MSLGFQAIPMLGMGADFRAENGKVHPVKWMVGPEIGSHLKHGAYLETDEILAIRNAIAARLSTFSSVFFILKGNLISL